MKEAAMIAILITLLIGFPAVMGFGLWQAETESNRIRQKLDAWAADLERRKAGK